MQEFTSKRHGLELRPMNLGLPAKESAHGHSDPAHEEQGGEEHEQYGDKCPDITPVVPIPNAERKVQARTGKNEGNGKGELIQALDQ